MFVLWQVLGLAGAIWAFTAGILYLFEDASKRAIREQTTAAWIRFTQTDPLTIVRVPFTLFSVFLDAVYGDKIFSWRALWRSCLVSTILLVAVLLLTGLVVHIPFGIANSPWKAFGDTLDVVSQTCANPTIVQNETVEQREFARQLCSTIASYNTPGCRLLYTVLFIVLIIVLNWLMDFVCLGISRILLRDMIEVRSFVSLFALHTMNFILVAVAGTTCLTLAVVAATPWTWGIVALLGFVSQGSKFLAMCLVVPALWCAIWFSPIWIRILAVVAALPSILLFLVTIIALLLMPWRARVHRSVSYLLDKIALREKAVVALGVTAGVVILTILVVILTFIPSMFQSSP